MTAQSELAPEEDQGFMFYQIKGSPNATAQQMLGYSQQMFAIGKALPEYEMMFQIIQPGTGIGGMLFTPWEERTKSAHVLQQELQAKWGAIAGGQVFAFQLPPLPGAQGAPIQVVINTTEPFAELERSHAGRAGQGQGQRQVLVRRHRPQDRQAANAPWSSIAISSRRSG